MFIKNWQMTITAKTQLTTIANACLNAIQGGHNNIMWQWWQLC